MCNKTNSHSMSDKKQHKDNLITSFQNPWALVLDSLSSLSHAALLCQLLHLLLASTALLRQLLYLFLASAGLQHQLQLCLGYLQSPPQLLNLCNTLCQLQKHIFCAMINGQCDNFVADFPLGLGNVTIYTVR